MYERRQLPRHCGEWRLALLPRLVRKALRLTHLILHGVLGTYDILEESCVFSPFRHSIVRMLGTWLSCAMSNDMLLPALQVTERQKCIYRGKRKILTIISLIIDTSSLAVRLRIYHHYIRRPRQVISIPFETRVSASTMKSMPTTPQKTKRLLLRTGFSKSSSLLISQANISTNCFGKS